MNHIMLDLETLDTRPSAVVLSIGAVAFDPKGTELGEMFYVEMTDDLLVQQQRGRTISASTVTWWMQQDTLAKRVFAQPSDTRMLTIAALSAFKGFVDAHGGNKAEIWGNGADFDNVVLGSLYDAMNMSRPWSYSRNRCFRTMKNLPNVPQHKHEGVAHNALDDAVSQALHLQEIYRCVLR